MDEKRIVYDPDSIHSILAAIEELKNHTFKDLVDNFKKIEMLYVELFQAKLNEWTADKAKTKSDLMN